MSAKRLKWNGEKWEERWEKSLRGNTHGYGRWRESGCSHANVSREELRCRTHNRGGPIITRHIAVNGTAGSVDNVKSGLVPS